MRRPLLTTGALVALVAATTAGYAGSGSAGGPAQPLSLTSATTGQSDGATTAQREEDAAHRAASSKVAVRMSADAERRAAAVAADAARAKAAAVAAATRLADARRAEAARSAREAQRQSVLAGAQADPKSAARLMLADYGWSSSQWSCLEQLWNGESGWDYRAANASSGSYGIPQALPASKMATVNADYRTNPVTQITWGMQYIKSSYGSPCGALSVWNGRSPHWY